MKERIKAKVVLGLPLTRYERGMYLLYVATLEEAKEFVKKYKKS